MADIGEPHSADSHADAFAGPHRFVQVTIVGGGSGGSDVALLPRQRMGSVPYALATPPPKPVPGQIQGFFMSYGDDALSLAVNVGGIAADLGNEVLIDASQIPTPFVKTSAAWGAGDGNGGGPASFAAHTWYPFFVIMNDAGDIDFGWDLPENAATAAELLAASGYTFARRIAWTLWAGQFILYYNDPVDPEVWHVKQQTIIAGGRLQQTISDGLYTETVDVKYYFPPNTRARILARLSNESTNYDQTFLIYSDANPPMFAGDFPNDVLFSLYTKPKTTSIAPFELTILDSQKIYYRVSGSVSHRVDINALGYRDFRGRHGGK